MPFGNPLDPFGAPDPMEDVLSLQTYSTDSAYLLAPSGQTVSCTQTCCPTATGTYTCGPKAEEEPSDTMAI